MNRAVRIVSRAFMPLIVCALVLGALVGIVGIALTGDLAGIHPSDSIVQSLTLAFTVAQNLALSLGFGYALTLALFEPGAGRTRGMESPLLTVSQNVLRKKSAGFTAAYVVFLALATYASYAYATGSLAPNQLGYYLLRTEVGTTTLWALGFGVVAVIFALLTRRLRGAGWLAGALALSMVSLGFLGHAGSSTDHGNAVNAMIVHILGMATWLGPLLVFLAECHRVSADHCATWLRRYSPFALFAIVALSFSGFVNALIRFDHLGQLFGTTYGLIVLSKVVLTVAIAVAGYMQRTRVLREGTGAKKGQDQAFSGVGMFSKLAKGELLIAALVLGLSAALSRSQPPVPQYVPLSQYRVLSLIGYDPPLDEFTVLSLVTRWHIDWIFLGVALAFAVYYVIGVRRLADRGDVWPMQRTVFWLLGCLALFWVMSGGPAAYGRARFDAHMTQHMALMVIVPPLLVLGGPVTLLSRAVAPRSDGSRGIREWILAILHSRYAAVVSSPPVAGFLFAGSLVLFYFSPFFTWAMFEHVGHLLMTVHFLLAGYLFAWVIMGVDPAQKPINPVLKLVTLLGTLTFHAFFGIAVVSATWIIGESWYNALGLWPHKELVRQQIAGGSIMWGISEIPTVFYAIMVAVNWERSEVRRARQFDRKADKDNNAELNAYNEYLKSLRGGE